MKVVQAVILRMIFIKHWEIQKTIGRYFYGYQEKWNWANFYAHADYTYRDMVAAFFECGG